MTDRYFLTKKFLLMAALCASVGGFLLFAIPHHAFAVIFTVDSNLDTSDDTAGDGFCDDGDGNCTLRAAIEEANDLAGADTIEFDAPMTITSGSVTYTISSEIVIDGTANGVSACSPLINPGIDILIPSGAFGSGINVGAGSEGTVIKGVALIGDGDGTGIGISSDDVTVQCSTVGLDSDGETAMPFGNGIAIGGVANVTIGGPSASDGNIISGNAVRGIMISDSVDNLVIQYNFIGTNTAGMVAVPNEERGILSSANDSDNIQILDNVLSGNIIEGAGFGGTGGLTNMVIQGNYIGVGSDGVTAIPNEYVGLSFNAPDSDVLIGGPNPGEKNIISGNTGPGLTLGGTGTIVVQGNYIGVGSDGTTAIGNGTGIESSGSSGVTIGGSDAGEGNIISGNTGDGISFDTIDTVSILGNSIGIDENGDALGNSGTGIIVNDSSNVTIGGTGTYERNVVSGNGGGIDVADTVTAAIVNNVVVLNDGTGIKSSNSTGVSIFGNYSGVLADGMTVAGNSAEGIEVAGGTGVVIGGPTVAERNISAGNGSIGILILNNASDVTISGNYIGVGSDGETVLVNSGGSIVLSDVSDAVVGGDGAGEGNIIATVDGETAISANSVSDVQIIGNYVGVGADGTTNLQIGNTFNIGILVVGEDVTIGGDIPGAANVIKNQNFGIMVGGPSEGISVKGNTIADNSFIGVLVLNTDLVPGNPVVSILQNSITNNGSLGIDIGEDTDSDLAPDINSGEDTNDSGDGDTGPNGYLNHAIITGINATTDTITYSLDIPTGYYHVEFFKNPTNGLHDSDYGEGEDFVGAAESVQSLGSALAGQTYVVSEGVEVDDVITATVTECTDATCTEFLATSEFSNSVTPVGSSTSSSGGGGGVHYGCKDPLALNYERFSSSRPALCKYAQTIVTTPIILSPIVPVRILKITSTGDDVRLLQNYLNLHGFPVSIVGLGSLNYETMYFGPRTRAAVIRFQGAYGLVPDGIVGPKTRSVMK